MTTASSILSTPAAATTTTQQQPGATTTTQTPANAPWFSDAHKAFLETKGFAGATNADPLIESYVNLEKLVGADKGKLLMLPKEGDAEAQAKFYNALGRPESADKYTPHEALKDDPLAKDMAPIAHELGLTDRQWSGLQKALVEQSAKLTAEADTAAAEQDKKHNATRLAALEADVGKDKMPGFLEEARRAIRTAVPETYKDPATGETITAEQINARIEQALGPDLALRIFNTLGKFQAEDRRVEGAPASGIPSKDAARQRLAQLQNDAAWHERRIKGGMDSAEQKEFERLTTILAST